MPESRDRRIAGDMAAHFQGHHQRQGEVLTEERESDGSAAKWSSAALLPVIDIYVDSANVAMAPLFVFGGAPG